MPEHGSQAGPRCRPRRIGNRRSWYDRLLVEYEGSHRPVLTVIPNLSTTGMFIATSEYFPEGAVLKVQFRLPSSGTEIAVRAEVRHCHAGIGIGVEFVNITHEAREAIEREVAHMAPVEEIEAQAAVTQ